jgi:hypothetical protein
MSSALYMRRLRPGERLTQTIWLLALRRGENLPMPTVERVNVLKRLVSDWSDEPVDGE